MKRAADFYASFHYLDIHEYYEYHKAILYLYRLHSFDNLVPVEIFLGFVVPSSIFWMHNRYWKRQLIF